MKVKARKVGNSLTITVPREVVTELGLTEDTDMNVFVREGAVVVEPVTSRWDRLVSRVRAEAAERGITESDVEQAVAEVRGRPSEQPAGHEPSADDAR
jgi:antitoxin component of MazEF toxin-antitoxin module